MLLDPAKKQDFVFKILKLGYLSLFSSMRGRQQLSCPVLRPPSGPNARPQDNMHLT